MAALSFGKISDQPKLVIAEARKAIVYALERLFDKDQSMLVGDIKEPSISHMVAIYLQPKFPELHVDCEYNRDGHKDPKVLHLFESIRPSNVTPDIIVHVRTKVANYFVIEVKKSTNTDANDRRRDHEKLRLFTLPIIPEIGNGFHYHVGLFLDIRTGADLGASGVMSAEGTWFVDGAVVDKEMLLSKPLTS